MIAGAPENTSQGVHVCAKASARPQGDDMASGWASDRTRLKPIHRRIEARCREVCAAAGRTWGRLPYPDRERFLLMALEGMDSRDVFRWSQRYSLGDILNAVLMPERGKHATQRVGRGGNEDE